MANKLSSNVNVDGEWYGPSYPDTKVTDKVAKAIDNPKAWADDDSAGDETSDQAGEVKQPPRKGPGSGGPAWTEFAASKGVTESFDSKDALIAELEKRDLLDKE